MGSVSPREEEAGRRGPREDGVRGRGVGLRQVGCTGTRAPEGWGDFPGEGSG